MSELGKSVSMLLTQGSNLQTFLPSHYPGLLLFIYAINFVVGKYDWVSWGSMRMCKTDMLKSVKWSWSNLPIPMTLNSFWNFEKPALNLFDCVTRVYYVYLIILNDRFLTNRSSHLIHRATLADHCQLEHDAVVKQVQALYAKRPPLLAPV